jgi:hypothetical protein
LGGQAAFDKSEGSQGICLLILVAHQLFDLDSYELLAPRYPLDLSLSVPRAMRKQIVEATRLKAIGKDVGLIAQLWNRCFPVIQRLNAEIRLRFEQRCDRL